MEDKTLDYEAALSAVLRWLDCVDRGEYQAAWSSASSQLKTDRKSRSGFAAGTTEHKWSTEVGSARSRLGALHSRRPRDDEIGPEEGGANVVLRFDTRFDNFEGARESVIVRVDPDRVWRVAGYRIVLGSQPYSHRASRPN